MAQVEAEEYGSISCIPAMGCCWGRVECQAGSSGKGGMLKLWVGEGGWVLGIFV